MNTQLAERNFMAATNTAYQFWLYELCDVYIVRRHLMRWRSAADRIRRKR
jgi:valyl-tRNA synthetase